MSRDPSVGVTLVMALVVSVVFSAVLISWNMGLIALPFVGSVKQPTPSTTTSVQAVLSNCNTTLPPNLATLVLCLSASTSNSRGWVGPNLLVNFGVSCVGGNGCLATAGGNYASSASWSWNFGDGSVSTIVGSTSHYYTTGTTGGVFHVTLSVVDLSGNSASVNLILVVNPGT